MGKIVIDSTAEYHVLKSYIIDSLGLTNYFITHYTKKPRGTQRPNFSKYLRGALNGFFYALEACFINLELP